MKEKTIFDLMADVTVNKVAWSQQTDVDKKQWNTFMVNKFLSMNYELVEIVNFLQSYTSQISPQMAYTVYLDVLPKKKFFSKYIGGKKTGSDVVTKFISDKMQMSIVDSEQLIERLMQTDEGKKDLKDYIRKFGYDDKLLKKEFKL